MEKSYSVVADLAAPAARYSHAVRVGFADGALVFVCGQLSLNANGEVVGGRDIAAQADQAFRNLATVLEANGASMSDVVQTTTYMTDISGLAAVNEVRAKHFPANSPTSTTVEVAALASPDLLIEVEAIAAV